MLADDLAAMRNSFDLEGSGTTDGTREQASPDVGPVEAVERVFDAGTPRSSQSGQSIDDLDEISLRINPFGAASPLSENRRAQMCSRPTIRSEWCLCRG